jgi:hypothetical protein
VWKREAIDGAHGDNEVNADYERCFWPTKAAVGNWIDRVYARCRHHSAIAMMSPVDFEDRLTQTAQAAGPCVHQPGSSPFRWILVF